jgi:hypothetical protein
MGGYRWWGMLALFGAASGCASDRILPAEARCGDGIVTQPEECDVESPGCESCLVTPGYTCDDSTCHEKCGDGEVVGAEECDPPDGIRCDQSCKEASRDGCSMDGWYVASQTNFSVDTVVGQVQASTLWYVYRFVQSGSAFEVREHLACGLLVTGSVTVSLDRGSARALLYSTHQGPDFAQGPRRGESARDGDGCRFTFERWYLIRGAEDRFLPEDFRALPQLSTLPALPREDNPLNPSPEGPDGAIDADGDGRAGFGLRLTGNLPGLRSVVQRDWNAYVTDADSNVVPDAVEFVARSDFDNQEEVLSVGDCEPGACAFLVAGSTPAQNLPGHVTFRYLGKDLTEPRVASIILGAPGSDAEVDLETCALVQGALPHDGTPPDPTPP